MAYRNGPKGRGDSLSDLKAGAQLAQAFVLREWLAAVLAGAALIASGMPARSQEGAQQGKSAVADAVATAGGLAAAAATATTDSPPPTMLPSVVVEARASRGPEGGGSLNNFSSAPESLTPLAIDRIDAAELLDRGVTSLSAAIRTDPSVGDNYNTFGYIENLQVRGFTLNELLNYQRDGMTVSSHVPVALENKEAIEILKGTSGMLEGASAPGGLVNYVLKQPTANDMVALESTVSERGSLLLHGDFGGHFGEQRQFGYRINLAAEERRPEIDRAWSKRALASGFFDWRASTDTLVQLEFEHQKVREISVPGFGLLDTGGTGVATTLPAPINPWINLNSQPWTQPFESTQTSASLRLQQRLGADWDFAVKAATQRSTTNDRIAFPDGCGNGPVPIPNYGGAPVYNGLCGNYYVDVYQYVSDDEVRNTNAADAKLHGRVHAGGIEQEITLGLRTTRYSERYPPQQIYQNVGAVAVFAPLALAPNAVPNTLNAPIDTDLDELYAFDVVHFAQRWSTWLGARATRITEDSSLTDGSQATALQQHLLTPWIGLGYEPWSGGFGYASAGSGVEVANAPNHPVTVQSNGAQLTLANPGQALPAQRSRQIEIGFKQRGGESWSLDATAFRIEKPFTDNVPLATGESLQVAGARVERHQGLELGGKWQALASVRLRAAATLIDARTIAAADPSWIGKPATNVAPLAASLQDAWSPAGLPGFSWSNLWTFSGHKSVLPNGSMALPNAWQWDSGIRYARNAQGMRWTWRAGVDNLTNRTYWREAPTASWGSIYLFPAPARSARLSLGLDW